MSTACFFMHHIHCIGFCLDTMKLKRGRGWQHRQAGESRIVSKQNAKAVPLHATEALEREI
jgi:hypothetical protein